MSIAKNTAYILVKDSPLLSFNSGNIEDSGRVLLKGTVLSGEIKTKVANIDGEKTPIKLIATENGFIMPSHVNIYTKEIHEIKGLKAKETPVRSSALGETKSSIEGRKRASLLNRFAFNVGIPALTGYIGYRVAKKQGGGVKKIAIYTIGFAALGFIPKLINKS
jgi:hypothetical protein